MTLRFVTASALDDFSTGILSSTHVLSPHPSIVNGALSQINLLARVHPPFYVSSRYNRQTYEGITTDTTGAQEEHQPKHPGKHLETMIQKHGQSGE